MENIFVVMPAYNEEANIAGVVKQWYPIVEKIGGKSKLVIVDDGSKDNTFKIMQELSNQYPLFSPITKANSGHGSTCLFAYKHAIDNGADWVFQTDSDGQTDPNEFWNFWKIRSQYDFIIGARTNRLDGFSRIVVTRVLKLVVWLKFGVSVKDANTPFRLMRAKELKSLLELIPPHFFLSNVLISTLAVLRKKRRIWIPITFKPRQGGVNSINLKRIFKIGVKALKDFNEAKRRIRVAESEEKNQVLIVKEGQA